MSADNAVTTAERAADGLNTELCCNNKKVMFCVSCSLVFMLYSYHDLE